MSHWEFSGNPAGSVTDTAARAAFVTPAGPTGPADAAPGPSYASVAELMPPLFDRDGRSIDFAAWVRLHLEDPRCERVATERVGPYWVSTLWLGIDAGRAPAPRRAGSRRAPAVFRTMVERLEDDATAPAALGIDEDALRYATEADARAGHEHVATLLSDAAGRPRRDLSV
jgi:hypothetical protein